MALTVPFKILTNRTASPTVETLLAQVAATAAEIAALQAENHQLAERVIKLEEDLALARLHRFAPSHEKTKDRIRGSGPDHRRPIRQELSCPLVDEVFTWLKTQAARVSRKSDLGEAMFYMLKREDGFRRFLDDGRVENAIRPIAMNRRIALCAGHHEGGRNWARFASLIGTCKMNRVKPHAYLRDLFTRLANGHLASNIDALMPWAYARAAENEIASVPEK